MNISQFQRSTSDRLSARSIVKMLLVIIVLLCQSNLVKADVIDDVLFIMTEYGGMDKSFKEAKPVIECMVANHGNAKACFNVQTEAEKKAGKIAQSYFPDDPKIRSIVELINHVKHKRWDRVLETAGFDVLMPLTCAAGLQSLGKLGNWVCSDVFEPILKDVAKPVLKDVIRIVVNDDSGFTKVYKLVVLVGDVELACQLIPDFPGKDETCSTLGKLIAELGGILADAGKFGVAILVNTADQVENLIMGNDAHMSYDRYYSLYWLSWLQKSVVICISHQCKGVGALNEKIWDACVDYFDAHNQYRSTAKKTCDDMRDKRYDKAYKELSNALKAGAEAHALKIRAGTKAWAITEYGKENYPSIEQHYLTVCETEMRQEYPMPAPSLQRCDAYKKLPKPFHMFYDKCVSEVKSQNPQPSPWELACRTAIPTFKSMLLDEQVTLTQSVQQIVAEQCFPPKGWRTQDGLRFVCQSYAGFNTCLKSFSVKKQSICGLDRVKADHSRAQEIVSLLGTRRCTQQGAAVDCDRPWKKQQCEKMKMLTPGINSNSQLLCRENSAEYFKLAFANQALAKTLNAQAVRSAGSAFSSGPNCQLAEDMATIRCKNVVELAKKLAQVPELQLLTCDPDPNYDGSDRRCYIRPVNLGQLAQAASTVPISQPQVSPHTERLINSENDISQTDNNARVASARRLEGGLGINQAAPPNPCFVDVGYWVPLTPYLMAENESVLIGQQVLLRCEFEFHQSRIEWPVCTQEVEVIRTKFLNQSLANFSSLIQVDGSNVGQKATTDKRRNFLLEKRWSFNSEGAHQITCQVDNPLMFKFPNADLYLMHAGKVMVIKGHVNQDPTAQSLRRINLPASDSLLRLIPNDSGAVVKPLVLGQ